MHILFLELVKQLFQLIKICNFFVGGGGGGGKNKKYLNRTEVQVEKQ